MLYTAELIAIKESLHYLRSNEHNNVTIFSDSKSALQAIANIYNDHPIVKEIHALIIEVGSRINIKLCWVPSHVEILGNERADKLATQAAANQDISPLRIPHTDFCSILKLKVRNAWKQSWLNIPPANNKLRRIKEDVQDWGLCFPKQRRLEVVLCRLRIGHTKLTHGHLMQGRPTNECETCGQRLTLEHAICHCQQYHAPRLASFGLANPRFEQILAKGSSFNPIIRFLTETGLYNQI